MKYMGSKARLAKDIAPIINKLIEKNNISTYVEPFVGGSNMIQNINCSNKIGNDINEYLIAMWKAIQYGWMPPEFITREEYHIIKDNKNEYLKELVAIVGFCASYNGRWFEGYAGKIKTKENTYRNYYDEAIRNILKQKEFLKDVVFISDDYKNLSYKKSLLYCDPPYENSKWYGYDKKFNHKQFWEWARDVSKNNIVLISEYNAPEDFKCIFEKKQVSSLDNKSSKLTIEKLFIHNL